MNTIKKIKNYMLLIAIVAIAPLSLIAIPAYAYEPVPTDVCAQAPDNPACKAGDADPILGNDGIIINVANYIAWFAGAIAVIMIIFAAFRFVKSSGDSAKVTAARETIIYALVGLVVIVLARVITGFVISKL